MAPVTVNSNTKTSIRNPALKLLSLALALCIWVISSVSQQSEIRLTNVARASLEELLEDYRDYLNTHNLPIWDKQSREANYVRQLGKTSPLSFEIFREFTETRPANVVANIAICLIYQTNYLLDQQIRRLEKDFLQNGGLRERMTQARLQARSQQKNTT